MKFRLLCLCAFVLLIVGIAWAGGGRYTVVVPSTEYPTIQSAIYSADEILVEPGYYSENVFAVVERDVTIRSMIPHSAIFDGGEGANTFNFRLGSGRVTMQNLTIINRQVPQYYSTAAVFVEFGPSITMQGCKVYSRSNGLSTNYTHSTIVENNEFYGIDRILSGPTGVRLAHQNIYQEPATGARVVGNLFFNLVTGIDTTCTFYPPALSNSLLPDSNYYVKVLNRQTQLAICR